MKKKLKKPVYQTSFDYDKKNDSARLVVDVTILPPEKVFAAIEEYVESVRYLSVDVSEVEAEAEASFQYILSMIDDIQPVTASIPIEFYSIMGNCVSMQ